MSEYQSYQGGIGSGVPSFGRENENYSQNIGTYGANLGNYDIFKSQQTPSNQGMQITLQQKEMRSESTAEVLKKAEDIIRNSQVGNSGISNNFSQKPVQPFSYGSNQLNSDNLGTSGIGKFDAMKRADEIIRNSQLSQIEVPKNQNISPSPSAGVFSQSFQSNNTLQNQKSVDDIINEIKTRNSQVGGSQLFSKQNEISQNQFGGNIPRDASPKPQTYGERPVGVVSSYVSNYGNNLNIAGNTPIAGNATPSSNANDIINRYKKNTFTSQYSENISHGQEFPQTSQQRTFAEDDTMKNHYNENSVFDIRQYTNSQQNTQQGDTNIQKILPPGFTPKQQFTPSQNNAQITHNTANMGGFSNFAGQGNNVPGVGNQDSKSALSSFIGTASQNDPRQNFSQSSISQTNQAAEAIAKKYSQQSLSSSMVNQQNNHSNYYQQPSQHTDSNRDLVNIQSNGSYVSQNPQNNIQSIYSQNLPNEYSQQTNQNRNNNNQQNNSQINQNKNIRQQEQKYENSGGYAMQQSNAPESFQQKQNPNSYEQDEKIKRSNAKQKPGNQYSASKQEKAQQEYSGPDDKVKVQVYKETLKRKKRDRIHHNATKIICFHIWRYVKRQRNKKNHNVLVQFIHHCASTIQKHARGMKTRKILRLPQIRKITKEIRDLEGERSMFPDDIQSVEQINYHIYEQKHLLSEQINIAKRGSGWAKQYQEKIKRSQKDSSQQQQKQQLYKQSSLKDSRKHIDQKEEEHERKQPGQKSNQRIPTEEGRERRESKTVRVKEPFEEKKHNAWDDVPVGGGKSKSKNQFVEEQKINPWDDVPVGGKSKKKNESAMTWDNAFPPDSKLDNRQKEFVEDQKKRSSIIKKKQSQEVQEEDEKIEPISDYKNAWDEVPIGGGKKKAMEQNWDEFPGGQKEVKKPKPPLKKAEPKPEITTDDRPVDPQKPKKNPKKTKEQLENLKKRTKYDPRKAIQEQKQKLQEDENNPPQQQNEEQEEKNVEQESPPIKKKPVKKPLKKPFQQNQDDEDDDIHVPNEDESQAKEDQDKQAVKKSPNRLQLKKQATANANAKKNQKENELFNVDDLNDKGEQDENGKSKKEFLKRKPKEIKFQKLNWKNVQSRTNTGRQELEQRVQYNKQQKAAQQQIQERQNQMKKNQKKQNQALPYYSELNYIDEDEAFNEPVKKTNNQNQPNSRTPSLQFDNMNQKQGPQQQYPVAPKVFTEYLPNKVQQKAIHQVSPTQPSQEIIIRPQMFQNKYANNNQNNMENIHYIEGNEQDIQENEQQQYQEYQQRLQNQQNQQNPNKYQFSDLDRMRQNKRESILSQQQQQHQQQYQQQQPNSQQQSQQFMQDYQRMSNQFTEEQMREIQMRQFQQSQNQHKQLFQFPQGFFKNDGRGSQQNQQQAIRYEDYIQNQQNQQQNQRSMQEYMIKKQQQFMKLNEFS